MATKASAELRDLDDTELETRLTETKRSCSTSALPA